jgi:hypothetical protein
VHDLSGRQDDLKAEDIVPSRSILGPFDSTGIGSHISSDGRNGTACRVWRKSETMFGQLPIEIVTDHSGLNMGIAVLDAYFKYPIHPGEVNDNSALDGDNSSTEACARTSGHNRYLRFISKLDNFGYLFG